MASRASLRLPQNPRLRRQNLLLMPRLKRRRQWRQFRPSGNWRNSRGTDSRNNHNPDPIGGNVNSGRDSCCVRSKYRSDNHSNGGRAQ